MQLRTCAALVLAVLLTACGVNPVTGKKEVQFVSEGQEVQIGEQQYAPSRQMQGGDFTVDPALTAYVSEVGNRLAKVSDRQLPYEFEVINNSVPNAWALPGGKIAVNRGLLTQLNSEAELAAVLGHEIVHSAARHGAKSMERGMLLQGAMLALQIGVRDNDYANLIVGAGMLGANLIATRYGREAELESDAYGMQYMKEAGYDPNAAIDLQKTFVKLSEGKRPGWLEGLFASHPPSVERVEKNTQKAAELGRGGDYGRERYQQSLASLRKMEPAYKKYDEGVEALRKKDVQTALTRADEARRMEPREAKFYELSGDAELSRKNFREALGFYDEALRRNPDYFKPHVQSGIARLQLNDKREAQQHLERSMQLLPTAVGAYYLGQIAKDNGDINKAAEYFQMAAGSNSDVGKASARELALMDLPRNPAKYVRVEPRLDNQGRVWLLVQNAAPVALNGVTIAAALFDPNGRMVQGPVRVSTGREAIGPGQVGQLPTNLGPVANPEALRGLRVEIESANVAE